MILVFALPVAVLAADSKEIAELRVRCDREMTELLARCDREMTELRARCDRERDKFQALCSTEGAVVVLCAKEKMSKELRTKCGREEARLQARCDKDRAQGTPACNRLARVRGRDEVIYMDFGARGPGESKPGPEQKTNSGEFRLRGSDAGTR
jgi:hypothetical protein